MTLKRLTATSVLGLLLAVIAAAPVVAAPVPRLEGTWLVEGPAERSPAALVSFGADGIVTVVVPDGFLSLPDGRRWPVVSPGQGSWRSRGFPHGEMTVALLVAGAAADTAPVLRLGMQITLAETGRRWTGVAWVEALDRDGRTQASRIELGTLTATRMLYGRW